MPEFRNNEELDLVATLFRFNGLPFGESVPSFQPSKRKLQLGFTNYFTGGDCQEGVDLVTCLNGFLKVEGKSLITMSTGSKRRFIRRA
jgi:hypothetical protein